MRFSNTASLALTLLSVAFAAPVPKQENADIDAQTNTINVSSDSGVVKIDAGKMAQDLNNLMVVKSDEGAVAIEIESLDKRSPQSSTNASPGPSAIINVAAGVSIVNGIIDIGTKVDKLIQAAVDSDIKNRQVFTQHTISQLRRNFPDQNFVMSNVGYNFKGDIIAKQQVFYHNHIGRKVSYDVLAFKKGHFELQGDGGFQNWAYLVDDECKTGGGIIDC